MKGRIKSIRSYVARSKDGFEKVGKSVERGHMTAVSVARDTGVPLPLVRSLLWFAEGAGYIVKDRGGRWHTTLAGRTRFG